MTNWDTRWVSRRWYFKSYCKCCSTGVFHIMNLFYLIPVRLYDLHLGWTSLLPGYCILFNSISNTKSFHGVIKSSLVHWVSIHLTSSEFSIYISRALHKIHGIYFTKWWNIHWCVTKFKHLYNFSHEKKDNTYVQVPNCYYFHDDVIKWKHFPRNWPFVRGIHRSRWIPRTKASDAELWCFLWSAPE